MTKIKICGLSRPIDIAYVNEAQPDYIGFNFYKKSKRYVTAEQAAELKKMLKSSITPVGVFVNAPLAFILQLAQQGVISYAQLHGDEDAAFAAALEAAGVSVIKVIHVRTAASLAGWQDFPCKYFLLDTATPGYGGSGQRFDLQVLAGHSLAKPFFLAGGLDADNVAAVIRAAHPFAVDVCGGVETDGVKDKAKIASFVAAVRKSH